MQSDVPPGQKYPRKLDELQTANMIKMTATKPADRQRRIENSQTTMGYTENPYMEGSFEKHCLMISDFGVRVSPNLVTCQGRVLDPPKLKYHPSSRESTLTPRDGGWNLRDKRVPIGATMESWSV
jgi:eukaryotic translation initiation factor 2C